MTNMNATRCAWCRRSGASKWDDLTQTTLCGGCAFKIAQALDYLLSEGCEIIPAPVAISPPTPQIDSKAPSGPVDESKSKKG
jgi:hypothetical protein